MGHFLTNAGSRPEDLFGHRVSPGQPWAVTREGQEGEDSNALSAHNDDRVCNVHFRGGRRADAARCAAGAGPDAVAGDHASAAPVRTDGAHPSAPGGGRARSGAGRGHRPAPQPAFKIETPNKSSIKLGLLLQPQLQSSQPRFGAPAETRTGWGNNLYIRRTRILLGGTLFGVLDYFVDTDFPNLFLATNVTTTDAMGMMVTNSASRARQG